MFLHVQFDFAFGCFDKLQRDKITKSAVAAKPLSIDYMVSAWLCYPRDIGDCHNP